AGTPTIPDVHANQAVTEQTLPLRPQDELECRRCAVHCDKVVYPSACLEQACPFVYAFEEFGHTYIGCMQKVYEVEIDLDLLRAAERTNGGFGAIRSVRPPLPMCRGPAVSAAAVNERPFQERAKIPATTRAGRSSQSEAWMSAVATASVSASKSAIRRSGTTRALIRSDNRPATMRAIPPPTWR